MSPLMLMRMRKQMERHKLPRDTYPPLWLGLLADRWGFWLIAGFALFVLVGTIVLLSLWP